MVDTRVLTYDDKVAGRKVLAFPPDLPFSPCLEELGAFFPRGEDREALVKLAGADKIYERSAGLADHLSGSDRAHEKLLQIAALAASGDVAGIRLMFAALVAVPPPAVLIKDLIDFSSVRRVMGRIKKEEKSGRELKESEEWFKKRITLLSMSHPLPNAASAPAEEPWLAWTEGVKRALASPDRKWDAAVLERSKIELEALDLRMKMLVASIDPDRNQKLAIYLMTLGEETKWKLQALQGVEGGLEEPIMIMRRKLGERWEGLLASLRGSAAGSHIADMIVAQLGKAHPHPHLKTGASFLKALMMHPLLARTKRAPDFLSCIYLAVTSAGAGRLEILLRTAVMARDLKTLLDLPGLEIDEKLLGIDLRRIPSDQFVKLDESPADVDWSNVKTENSISYKTLVLTYIDNDNFLCELLNNPKIVAKPGVISLIALRCRSPRVLSIIANQRTFYTGFVNKEVPYNLIVNPARVSLTSLRKFIHVRYVDRVTLQRLTQRAGQIREEVRREIQRYLSSMG